MTIDFNEDERRVTSRALGRLMVNAERDGKKELADHCRSALERLEE